jgi:hypothetical protein
VPPKLWGCRRHWFRLPARLRAKIWAAYRPGQEITKDPSPEYIQAAREVRDRCLAWIREHEPKGLFQ